MKTTSKVSAFPHLHDQPSYREALAKLNHFRVTRQAEQEQLGALRIELSKATDPDQMERTEESVIAKAEALISRGAPRESLAEQIQTKVRLIAALDVAATAQAAIVSRIEQTLSREIGQQVADEHKAVVKRLIAAVQELHEANLAEIGFQNALERHGYYGALPSMSFDQQTETDPENLMGCRAYYWTRDAKAYVG